MNGKVFGAGSAAGFVLATLLCWMLWHPKAPVIEPAAPAQHQPDGSVILARRPDTVIKIVHQIPKGWVPEREVQLAVAPPPIVRVDTVQTPAGVVIKTDTIAPAAVKLELTEARLPDGTHRVIVSSSGKVLDSLSIDVPIGQTTAPARALTWSAGVTRDLLTAAWGAVISKDLGPARLYILGEPKQATNVAQLKLGVAMRF